MRRFIQLSTVIAALIIAVPTLGQSFSTVKDRFETGLASKDRDTRVAAIKELSQHGSVQTVKLLLETLKRITGDVTRARTEWAQATLARSQASREESRLRSLLNSKKIGKRKWEEAKKVLDAATTRVKRYERTVKNDADLTAVLRKAVGWTFQRCSDVHKRDGVYIIRSAYKSSKGIEDRADMLRVMVWVDEPSLTDLLIGETRHREAPTRVAALRALEERGGKRALRPAVACLNDEVWQVRAQAIRILRKVGGSVAAVALCDALEAEDGRLITDAVTALRRITGQDFHDNVHLWREWIAKNGASLPQPEEVANAAPPKKEPKKKPAVAARGPRKHSGTGFYGINTKSPHLIYVVDISGSMSALLKPKKGDPNNGDTKPARIGGKRRIDGVATELLTSIDSLKRDATFNVILFDTGVTTWRDKMAPATQANKAAIRKWVLERGPAGSTNLFGGLEKAFQIAGRGSFDRRYKNNVDTIFLLSDGAPSAGRIQAVGEILKEIRALNDLRRIAIHCVGLGRGINASFLRQLAEQNDGEFAHVAK